MDKLAALRQYFGFSEFRAGQQTLIDAVLSGRDALGIMPMSVVKIRRRSSVTAVPSWPQPMRSAWASTSRTCVM